MACDRRIMLIMSKCIARTNMVKQQLRTIGITDERVLETFTKIAREAFVPTESEYLAYADRQTPLAHQQVMLPPGKQAMAVQALAIKPTDRVLEIGTGSGYLTTILANLSAQVISVDEFPDFIRAAEQQLHHYDINNVKLIAQDAFRHWQDITKYGPFDAILCTAGLYTLPNCLTDALSTGGRLFAIVGDEPTMQAKLIRQEGHNRWQIDVLFETIVPYANSITQPEAFIF